MKRMKRWYSILLLLCALALVAGAGFWGFRSSAAQANPNLAAPTTVAATTCDVQQSVTAPGNLVNQHQVNLQMPADGSLQEILVRPGDHVQEGQVLARLADRERFASAVTAARLELLQAQHDLEKLSQDAPMDAAQAHLAVVEAQKALDDLLHPSETAIAEALKAVQHAQDVVDTAKTHIVTANYTRGTQQTIAAAQAAYVIAKQEVTRLEREYKNTKGDPSKDAPKALALSRLEAARVRATQALNNLNYVSGKYTQAEIDERNTNLALAEAQLADAQAALEKLTNPSTEDVALARAKLEQAEKEWERLKDGSDELTLALAQAKIDDAQAKLDEAERNLEAVEIKAPFAGVVLEVSANPGETLAAHSTVIVLNDPRQVEIEATVTEEDFPLLKPGQSAQVYFTARPDVIAQGKVDRIVPKLVEGSSPTYDIFVSLDKVPDGLVDGMTVDTNVTIASRPGVICLPRSVVHASADNKAILQVWDGVQAENRQVTIGLRGDSNVEILSGLKEGEQVVVK